VQDDPDFHELITHFRFSFVSNIQNNHLAVSSFALPDRLSPMNFFAGFMLRHRVPPKLSTDIVMICFLIKLTQSTDYILAGYEPAVNDELR
jgi:hypothetical protein